VDVEGRWGEEGSGGGEEESGGWTQAIDGDVGPKVRSSNERDAACVDRSGFVLKSRRGCLRRRS
jgi:hypothetical protein